KQAAQGAEFERAVEVDVLLALGVAVGEMRVDIDQPRHHETAGMVDQPVASGAARRPGLRADVKELALIVEDQRPTLLRLVFRSGEQRAAADKGVHRDLLRRVIRRSIYSDSAVWYARNNPLVGVSLIRDRDGGDWIGTV